MNSYHHQKGFAFIAVIIVVALLGAGGGTYYAVKKHSEYKANVQASAAAEAQATTTSSVDAKADASIKISGDLTLRSILGKGGDYQCTFDQTVSNSRSKGIVYISKTEIRGDFTTMTAGGNIESHMIKKGDDIYVWSSAMPTQGVKMSASATASAQSGAQQGIDLDTKLSYDCKPWTPVAAQFILPSALTFIDVSAMMQGGINIK